MAENGSASSPAPAGAVRAVPLPGARPALILLLLINLFNYIDRYVLAELVPRIRDQFFPDVHDSLRDFWMGALAPAFLVSYLALSPLFGWLGDRFPRWWLIGVGIILWSLASGGTGLAATFTILFLTRCLVGVGEAAYTPVAPTIIADLYPVQIRGTVLAVFYAAIPVGSALGYALGGMVTQTLGWHWNRAFFLVVPPGILLGLLCFLMPSPRRGQAEEGLVHALGPPRLRQFLDLLRIRSYLFNNLGMTAMTFAFGGLAFWMPAYLQDQRGKPTLWGLDSGTAFGGLTALAGLTGTLFGGWLGDRLRPRFPGAYFLVSGITMIIGFPLVLLVLAAPFPINWVVIFLTVFCLFVNTGPTNTILANVVHPAVRARAFALNIFIIHVLGDVISPPVIGLVKSFTGSLDAGFVVVSAMILLGGAIWIWGARYLEEDTQLAPTRAPS